MRESAVGDPPQMDVPSVKGTIVRNLVSDFEELISAGRLEREQLHAKLDAGDLALLSPDVMLSAWYPVASYGRLLELFADASGGDRREQLIESGRRSARRVIELGIYSQLDDRTEETWENRVGRILVTLSGSFFNFGRWEWQGLQADGGFSIAVHESSAMPDPLVLRTGGFVEHLAERAAGGSVRMALQRSPDKSTIRYEVHRLR
jgi:hypothetical protein